MAGEKRARPGIQRQQRQAPAAADHEGDGALGEKAGGQEQGRERRSRCLVALVPAQQKIEGEGTEGGHRNVQFQHAAVDGEAEKGGGDQPRQQPPGEAGAKLQGDEGDPEHQQRGQCHRNQPRSPQGDAERFMAGAGQPVQHGRLFQPWRAVQAGHQPLLLLHHAHGSTQAEEILVLAGDTGVLPDAHGEQGQRGEKQHGEGQAAAPRTPVGPAFDL